MALINCPECGKQISDLSSICIHCGYPLKQPPKVPSPSAGMTPVSPAADQNLPFPVSPAPSGLRALLADSRKRWWVIGGAVALVAIIVIVLVLALGGSKDDQDSSSGTNQAAAGEPAAPGSVQPTGGEPAAPGSVQPTGGEPVGSGSDQPNSGEPVGSGSDQPNSGIIPGLEPDLSAAGIFAGPESNQTFIKEPENIHTSAPAASSIPIYGITVDMGEPEVTDALTKAGLEVSHNGVSGNIEGFSVQCEGGELFGVTASQMQIDGAKWGVNNSRAFTILQLDFECYDEDKWNRSNSLGFQDAYNKVLAETKAKLGEPRVYQEDYEENILWEQDGVIYIMSPLKAKIFHFAVCLGVSSFDELKRMIEEVRNLNTD